MNVAKTKTSAHRKAERILKFLDDIFGGCKTTNGVARRLHKLNIKGDTLEEERCPLAVLLKQHFRNVSVAFHICFMSKGELHEVETPGLLCQFIKCFDKGMFPFLENRKTKT